MPSAAFFPPTLFSFTLSQQGNKRKHGEPSLLLCAKETFSGPLAVIRYLGRYTHRIAVSNTRMIAMDEHTVTMTVKDRKNTSKTKTLTLTGVEWIRRFFLHVLPKGFVKIRHYGLLANRNKKTKLALSRKLTGSPALKAKFAGLTTVEILCILTGKDITRCPSCHARPRQDAVSFSQRASPA